MSIHARFVCKLLALAACAAAASAALADDNTRYISLAGSNANACTFASPCRTFQRGINVTPAGGKLVVLDPGFYGNNAIIGKSITISGNGRPIVLGDTITINDADAVVALRGLVLNGQGAIENAIDITAANAVHVERCVIHNYTGRGINATATNVELFVLDTVIRDNGDFGIIINAGASSLVVDNTRIENNSNNGIHVQSGDAAVSRSILSDNFHGIAALNASVSVASTMAVRNNSVGFFSGSGATVTVESSVAHGNSIGVNVNSGATARISNNAITGNNTGVNNNGVAETRSNNTVEGNTDDLNGLALTAIGGT